MYTFETSGPTTVVVRAGAGHVTVTASDSDRDLGRTTVELSALTSAAEQAVAEASVEQQGDVVMVDVPRSRWGLTRQSPPIAIVVSCPTGSSLRIQAESSDVRAQGRYAEADIATGSGLIAVEAVTGSAKLRSGSGAVHAGEVDGRLTIATGSGDVEVGHTAQRAAVTAGSGDISIGELAGELVSKTGSGDVEIGRLAGDLRTKSGSGSLTVRRATAGTVVATGASGSISIGVEEGTAAWLDVSTLTGRVSQELSESNGPGADQRRVEITAHTVSGNLRVHRS